MSEFAKDESSILSTSKPYKTLQKSTDIILQAFAVFAFCPIAILQMLRYAASEFLKLIESLMTRLERESEFMHYLNSIRVTHKAKRNLMKLLQLKGY